MKIEIAVFGIDFSKKKATTNLVGVFNSEAEASAAVDQAGNGAYKEYKRTFETEEQAVSWFGVPAAWALENGREKFGKRTGGKFYGYESLESGEFTVWSNF
jgi:hypothetical protein